MAGVTVIGIGDGNGRRRVAGTGVFDGVAVGHRGFPYVVGVLCAGRGVEGQPGEGDAVSCGRAGAELFGVTHRGAVTRAANPAVNLDHQGGEVAFRHHGGDPLLCDHLLPWAAGVVVGDSHRLAAVVQTQGNLAVCRVHGGCITIHLGFGHGVFAQQQAVKFLALAMFEGEGFVKAFRPGHFEAEGRGAYKFFVRQASHRLGDLELAHQLVDKLCCQGGENRIDIRWGNGS